MHEDTVKSRHSPLYIYITRQSYTHLQAHIHMAALTRTTTGPLIARLSNNHDALGWGALAGFAFHTRLLFKDTQGREWNHLSQREAQRLEAPPAEKPVYFGWQNTLGYGCVCVCVYARVGVCTQNNHFCLCVKPISSWAYVLIKMPLQNNSTE